jgi:hypothetical protein
MISPGPLDAELRNAVGSGQHEDHAVRRVALSEQVIAGLDDAAARHCFQPFEIEIGLGRFVHLADEGADLQQAENVQRQQDHVQDHDWMGAVEIAVGNENRLLKMPAMRRCSIVFIEKVRRTRNAAI